MSALRTLTKRLFYYSRRIASNEHHDFLVNEYDDTLPPLYNTFVISLNCHKGVRNVIANLRQVLVSENHLKENFALEFSSKYFNNLVDIVN